MPRRGLSLVLGPPNSGKLGRVLAWRQEFLPWRPLIVTPTATVAEEVTRELLRRTGAVVGQAQALTFEGLAREMLPGPQTYLSELQSELLIASALSEVPLSKLDAAAPFPGLSASLGLLLQQFAESGRTTDDIDHILHEWARREPTVAGLAGDLQMIFAAYVAGCAALGLVERPAAVRAACDQTDDWSRPVAFYGFTSFTHGQRRLIDRLILRVPILVTFDHERGRPAGLADSAEVERWERVAAQVELLPPQSRAYSCPAIAHLERGLFSDDIDVASPVAGAEGVRFLLASGQRAEAELAVQHVVALIQEGFAPDDIAVIVKDPQSRGRLLGQVFDSCGVAYQLDAVLRLAETGLGHAFLAALRAVQRADPDALLAFLGGPYSGLTWSESAHLELSYRRSPIGGFAALGAIVDAQVPALLESVRRCLNAGAEGLAVAPRALRPLARDMLIAGLKCEHPPLGERPLEEWQPPEGEILPASRGWLSREAEDDIQAFSALQRAFDQVEMMQNEAGLRVALDAETVLACLGRVRVQRDGGPTGVGVSILSPARARARRFAAVLVLGLVEGEFPARSDRPTLLTESQRRGLEAVGGAGIVARREDDDEALFLSAVSRPWQVLYLSARDTDDGGGEVLPSRFWTQAKALLGRDTDEHEKRGLGDVVFAEDSAPTPRHYRRALAAGHGVAAGRAWRRPPAVLHDAAVLAELAAMDCFSPSALESYLTCPFAWFLQRVVGVEDLTEELDGRVMGTLLHTALSRVYRELPVQTGLSLREDLSRANEIGSAAVDESVSGAACPGTAAERRIVAWRVKRLMRTALTMEAAWGSRLVAAGTEVPVGGAGGVDIGGLRIRGRVDRIDADPAGGGLFVVDYKSGKVPSPRQIGSEKSLQLPLYLLALGAEAAEQSGAEQSGAERPPGSLGAERAWQPIIGGVYLSPSEEKRSGIAIADRLDVLGLPDGGASGLRVLSDEEAEGFFQDARDTAVRAAEAMRSGVIAPLAGRACPSYCDLRSACRSYKGRAGA